MTPPKGPKYCASRLADICGLTEEETLEIIKSEWEQPTERGKE